MSDRERPLSLWGSWWNAIELLRPAFSRLSTFLWFATIVAGMTVRADMLGVTSIVRALNLRPALYHRLLAHFHSTGVKLDRLAALLFERRSSWSTAASLSMMSWISSRGLSVLGDRATVPLPGPTAAPRPLASSGPVRLTSCTLSPGFMRGVSWSMPS